MDEEGYDGDGGGYGKTQRGRRYRTQAGKTPYSRPAPKPRVEDDPPLQTLPIDELPRQGGLFGSLRSLITKVPVLGSYFVAVSAEPPPTDHDVDGDIEVVLDLQVPDAGDGGASGSGEEARRQEEPAQPVTCPAGQGQPADQRGTQGGPAQQQAALAGAAQARRVAFQSPAASGKHGEEAAGTPQVPPRCGDGNGSDVGTPYDDVLAMLRQGPLATNSPRYFPRPRSSSLLMANAGRTPGPSLAFGGSASPSSLPPSGGTEFGGRRGGYAGSRLGPQAAGGGNCTPSTGLRTTYTARSNSRFSRTPVHMQPLAAGVPAGSGGPGGGTSRFGLAAASAAAAAGRAAGGTETGAGTSLLSPAPLAWTPMRSNLVAGSCSGGHTSNTKRKAELSNPDTGTEGGDGTISLLDVQRRIRQCSQPAGGAPSTGSDRRAWNAGRTPFHSKAAGPSRFGAIQQQKQQQLAAVAGGLGARWEQQQQENSASPVLLPGVLLGAPAVAGAAGNKATTDTARRILATLDALDKVVVGSPLGTSAVGVAATMGEEEEPAASAPPTDSLGFAGLPRGEPAHEPVAGGRGRTVKFGGVTFAPTPTPTSSPMAKASAATVSAATPEAAANGWGGAFLAANKGKAAPAAEAEGGAKTAQQAEQPATGFTFGLPAAQTASPEGMPTMKQHAQKAAAEPSAAAVPPELSTLFSFGTASKPAEPVVAFAALKPAADADSSAAPKFAFGGSRSNDTDHTVAAAVAAAPAAGAAGPTPTYVFGGGGKKAEEGRGAEAAWTPLLTAKPLVEANQAAAEAAKSPLPDSDLSDEEGGSGRVAAASKPAEKSAVAAKPVAASGNWGRAFLEKNKVAAQQATEAAAEEADGAQPSAIKPLAIAETPNFAFGAPSTATAGSIPAPSFGLSAPAISAAGGAGPASVPAFSFGSPAQPSAAAGTFTFGAAPGSEAASVPLLSVPGKAASGAATTAAPAEALAPASSAAASGASWGDAFLKANQAAASQATNAAAQEIDGAGLGSRTGAAAAASAPALSFGIPASSSGAAAMPVTVAPFSFGVPASASAAGQTTAVPSSAALKFGVPAAATASGFTAGAGKPAEPAAAAPALAFGATLAPSAAAAAPASSAPMPSFGVHVQPGSSAAVAAPFLFGAGLAQPQPAAEAAAAPAAPAALFNFGAAAQQPSSAASAPAASTFAFGAASSAPAVPASSTPGFNFPAAAGPVPFAFGPHGGAPAAPATGVAAPFTFGAAAAVPAPSFGAAASGFAFGASSNSSGFAGNGGMGSIEMVENGNVGASMAAPATGFQFGAAQTGGPPTFGGTFTFGQQPATAAPVFGATGFGAAPTSQPGFGGFGGQAAAAPAFGASQQPAFGGAAPFTFGVGQLQQPGPGPAAGGMVPNNPFGGGMGGGFNMGSAGGGSQSESGRRKLRVKRAGRK